MNIKKISNDVINIFLGIITVISIIAAVSLLKDQLFSISRTTLLILDICLIILTFVFIFKETFIKFLKSIYKICKNRKALLLISVSLLLMIWQVYLILTISGFCYWDPGIIMTKAMNKIPWSSMRYFSFYPNTFGMLMLEHGLWLTLGKPGIRSFTLILNLINVVVLDSSLYILFRVSKKYFNQRIASYALVTSVLLFGISPWICIPYTDVLSFAITIWTIWILLIIHNQKRVSILYSLLTGFLIFLGYMIKPSLMITTIAFFIVSVVFVKPSKLVVNRIINIIVMMTIFILMISGLNFAKFHNGFLNLNRNDEFSLYHFAAMGINGMGGYNQGDVDADAALTNANSRKQHDQKLWRDRYRKMGFLGYESFLIRKQTFNSAEGSLGWGKEGNFLTVFKYKKGKYGKAFSRKLFLNNSGIAEKYNGFYGFIVQLTWIIVLTLILFSFSSSSFNVQLIKYSVVGFFTFLLLFEGGRARYIIQFLPLVILLSSIGFDNIMKWIIRRSN